MKIRVATYNVHNTDGSRSLEGIAAEISATGADLVALQELETKGLGCRIAQLLAEHGMLGHKRERGTVDGVIQFMVAARCGKNDTRIPFHCLSKHEVGSGITGME